MRLLDFRGPGLTGLGAVLSGTAALRSAAVGTAFAGAAALLALSVGTQALAQQVRPSPAVYEGPKCFNTVIPDVVATVAHVTGSRMPGQEIYSIGDTLFVEVDEGPLTVGEEYLLYRVEGRIRHPRGGAEIGDAINLVGQVRVLESDGVRGLVEATQLCGELEAGDRLHPLLSQQIALPVEEPEFQPIRLVTVEPGDATVVFGSGETLGRRDRTGEVRGSMTQRQTYAVGDVVTIDQGRAGGWMPGAWAIFYNDALPDEAAETVRLAGPVISAQGYVLWATDTTAALMITQGQGAVMLGNRARPIR